MWSRQLLLSLLTLLLASPVFGSTVVIGRGDARTCYFATLNSQTPAQLKLGFDACTRAIDQNTDYTYLHAALLVNRSDIRLRMNDYAGAVADADASIALDPTLTAAYINRGAGLIGLKRYREALQPLERAIALNTGDRLQEAYFNRGLAREYLGDIRGAYFDYKKAVELDSNFEPAKTQLTRFTVINK